MTASLAPELDRPVRRVQITGNADLGAYTPTPERQTLREWATAHLRAGWAVTITGTTAHAVLGNTTKTAHT